MYLIFFIGQPAFLNSEYFEIKKPTMWVYEYGLM
jgi:hypothetical protein